MNATLLQCYVRTDMRLLASKGSCLDLAKDSCAGLCLECVIGVRTQHIYTMHTHLYIYIYIHIHTYIYIYIA